MLHEKDESVIKTKWKNISKKVETKILGYGKKLFGYKLFIYIFYIV